jgi:hypothetical protein
MLQVFYRDVAKVDLDVAYACMLQTYVSSVFRCFIRMFVFYLDVAYVYNGFQIFSGVFTNVSDVYFKCFICLLLYVAFECFKSRGVAHGMWVGSCRWHEQRPERCGRRQCGRRPKQCRPTASALIHEPDALDARQRSDQTPGRWQVYFLRHQGFRGWSLIRRLMVHG